MNAEPSVPEGLRTLLVFHVTRTRGLVALGLLSLAVGVGIASGIGSAEDGSESNPYTSIAAAVDAVAPGGRIKVKPGSTPEAIRITKRAS